MNSVRRPSQTTSSQSSRSSNSPKSGMPSTRMCANERIRFPLWCPSFADADRNRARSRFAHCPVGTAPLAHPRPRPEAPRRRSCLEIRGKWSGRGREVPWGVWARIRLLPEKDARRPKLFFFAPSNACSGTFVKSRCLSFFWESFVDVASAPGEGDLRIASSTLERLAASWSRPRILQRTYRSSFPSTDGALC